MALLEENALVISSVERFSKGVISLSYVVDWRRGGEGFPPRKASIVFHGALVSSVTQSSPRCFEEE